ncbi:hypothetical protein EJB05_42855, partial [Eragrostis curvula]
MAYAAAASSPRQADDAQQAQLPHVVIFPFMAKGHTIPLIQLAHLLRHRQLATVSFLTTPGNAAFVRAALSGADDVSVVELPFTDHAIPGAPPAVECVEALDSLSSLPAFVEAVSALRPRFEQALAAMRPTASVVVTDPFLYWAHAAAAGLGVRTLSFFVTSMFAYVIREVCVSDNPAAVLSSGGAVFTVPQFPHIRLALADMPVPYDDPTLPGRNREMESKVGKAIADSQGFIVNTFDAMESQYIEHWNRHVGPRAWPVGPLCLTRSTPPSAHGGTPAWMRWLDEKAAAGRAVLYVAFGTLMALPEAQLRALADGLEQSGLDFLWVVRPMDVVLPSGFVERVRGRAMVVREWVDQWAILGHECVKGFFSHCGWNSTLESISAGVPLATWPISAEQPLNAKLIAEELGIGLKVSARNVAGGLVSSKEIAAVVRELIAGEKGEETARNAAAMAAKAREAVAEGGSSWKALQELINGLNRPGDDASMEV